MVSNQTMAILLLVAAGAGYYHGTQKGIDAACISGSTVCTDRPKFISPLYQERRY